MTTGTADFRLGSGAEIFERGNEISFGGQNLEDAEEHYSRALDYRYRVSDVLPLLAGLQHSGADVAVKAGSVFRIIAGHDRSGLILLPTQLAK
jgi:hypothetical protein